MTEMPPIWWSPSEGKYFNYDGGYGTPFHMLITLAPGDELPDDAQVLVTVDFLKNFYNDASENNRKLATELAEVNAQLKARIRQLEAELPEVECPSCSAVIRARLADQ